MTHYLQHLFAAARTLPEKNAVLDAACNQGRQEAGLDVVVVQRKRTVKSAFYEQPKTHEELRYMAAVRAVEQCRTKGDAAMRLDISRTTLDKILKSGGVKTNLKRLVLLLCFVLAGCVTKQPSRLASINAVVMPPTPPVPMMTTEIHGLALAPPDTLSLAWDASPSAGVTGYRVYEGPASGDYPRSYVVGQALGVTIPKPVAPTHFVVTAYESEAGAESDFSNEVKFTPAIVTASLNFYTYIFRADWSGSPGTLETSADLGTNKTWTVVRPIATGESVLITNDQQRAFFRVRIP